MAGMHYGTEELGFWPVHGWMAVGLQTLGSDWSCTMPGKPPLLEAYHPFQTVGSFRVVPKHLPSPHSHSHVQSSPQEGARPRHRSVLAPTRLGVAIAGSHFPGKPQLGNALGTSRRGGSLFKSPAGPGGMGAR